MTLCLSGVPLTIFELSVQPKLTWHRRYCIRIWFRNINWKYVSNDNIQIDHPTFYTSESNKVDICSLTSGIEMTCLIFGAHNSFSSSAFDRNSHWSIWTHALVKFLFIMIIHLVFHSVRKQLTELQYDQSNRLFFYRSKLKMYFCNTRNVLKNFKTNVHRRIASRNKTIDLHIFSNQAIEVERAGQNILTGTAIT